MFADTVVSTSWGSWSGDSTFSESSWQALSTDPLTTHPSPTQTHQTHPEPTQPDLFSTPSFTLYKPFFLKAHAHYPLTQWPSTHFKYDIRFELYESILHDNLNLNLVVQRLVVHDSLSWWLQWDFTLLLSSWNWQTWKSSYPKLAFPKIHCRLEENTKIRRWRF